jgi:ribosomal protein S18 acetylase RimI-like enzyme
MIVDKQFRGKGVGKKLMVQMQYWAENKGITRMQLLADKTNVPALAYYCKLGWAQTKMFCLRKYTNIK